MDNASVGFGEAPMTLYELAIMGTASESQVAELAKQISQIIEPFRLRLGQEVALRVLPDVFRPAGKTPAAVAFFGLNLANAEILAK
jgi:hypothetical protein